MRCDAIIVCADCYLAEARLPPAPHCPVRELNVLAVGIASTLYNRPFVRAADDTRGELAQTA